MNSVDRRKEISKILEDLQMPIAASLLAKKFGVTRQIIVKDIGILKAEKLEIISTARGYLLNKNDYGCRKELTVCHSSEKIEDELNTIVDLGGRVLTTAITHSIYGRLEETLNIRSRKDIKKFLLSIEESGCEPLLMLTKGKHFHLVEADDEESLKEILQAMCEKEYLILEE